MREEIKIGDRVLVKKLFGNIFHMNVIGIGKGLFGTYYIGRYFTQSDFSGRQETAGVFRKWNIIGKN